VINSFNKNLFSIWLIAVTLLWPLKINFISLNIPFVSLFSIIFCFFISKKIESYKSLILFIGLLFLFSLVSLIQCDMFFITKSFLTFLSFIPILFVSSYFSKLNFIEDTNTLNKISGIILTITILCFLLQFLGFFEHVKGYKNLFQFYAPFLEPSHLAISLFPFILISFYFGNIRNKIFSFIIIAASFSTTMIGLFFSVLILKNLFKNIRFIFLLILSALLLFFINDQFNLRITGILNFFTGDNVKNLSSKVYIYGYITSFFNLFNSSFLGLGFNAMGCIDISTVDGMFDFFNKNHADDGSFLASKIISEFGIIGIFLLIAMFVKVFKFSLQGIDRQAQISHTLTLTFLCIVFIRSPSYYSIVYLLPFVIHFLDRSYKANVIKQ